MSEKAINLRWLIWDLFPNVSDRQNVIETLDVLKGQGQVTDSVRDIMMACLNEDNSNEKKWVEV